MNISRYLFSKKKNKTKKLRRVKKQFKKMNCSPAVKNQITEDSCFTPEIFLKILRKYNEKNKDNKILETDLKAAWFTLKDRLSCKKEECWLDQLGDEKMKKQIQDHVFAPKHPPDWNDDPDAWLSNFDIEDVAKQYEHSYPEFKLLGPTTIDFDTRLPEANGKCVLEDLCKFSLEKMIEEHKTKIGIVFNLDHHDQDGSHWVSMFIDIPNHFIFFFDSADNGVPKEVYIPEKEGGKKKNKKNKTKKTPLVNRIMKQGMELSPPIKFDFYSNEGVMHQRGNSECGMYSLFFIITMLTGRTPFSKGELSVEERRDLFLKTKIPDKVVFKYRKLYFND